MNEFSPSTSKALRALANPNRLKIVEWLSNPQANFPPQLDGDLVEDGVCLANIVDKLGLAQPTVTNHMHTLANAGLVTSKPVKNWVFYKLDKPALKQMLALFASQVGVGNSEEG